MKIKALRTIRTDVGNVRRGEETDALSDAVANSLIGRGLAEEVVSEGEAPKAKRKRAPARAKGQGAAAKRQSRAKKQD